MSDINDYPVLMIDRIREINELLWYDLLDDHEQFELEKEKEALKEALVLRHGYDYETIELIDNQDNDYQHDK